MDRQRGGAELEWVRAHAAVSSASMHAGEYEMSYVVTPSTGWYGSGGGLRASSAAAMHIGIVVRDGADGRLVPNLDVRGTLTDAMGQVMANGALPFGWHPVLNRYGDDWPLPTSGGPFTLRVVVGAPDFRRHDPINGDRFGDSTVAEFTNVAIAADLPRTLGGAEGSAEALRLARREGEMLGRSMYEMIGGEAVNGQVMRSGYYIVVAGVEFSEGYWTRRGDALTGRFLPDLNVRATLLRDGHTIGTMAAVHVASVALSLRRELASASLGSLRLSRSRGSYRSPLRFSRRSRFHHPLLGVRAVRDADWRRWADALANLGCDRRVKLH